MAGTRRFFKVFLASPSDLTDERMAAKRVVDEFNGQLAEKLGYQAELVGWEDTLPGMGRPQALINRDLDGCDLFVGLLWKRWGTPPDNSGAYTSGFEEEFRLSVDRFEREQRPEIHLLLKDIEAAALQDPGDQLRRVQEFRKQVFSERRLLAKTFADLSAFERAFRQCIQGFAIALGEREAVQEPQRSKTTAEGEDQHPESDAVDVSDSALSREGASFLKGLLRQLQQQPDYSPTAVEVARFRLLSAMISAQGNDEGSLGAHDSNILFRHRKDLAFSNQEQIALLDAGLDNYKAENVPLWYWISRAAAFAPQILVISSVVGPTVVRQVAAISAMCLIGTPIVDTATIKRHRILELWFQKDSDSRIKTAAVNYLADWGSLSDIELLRAEAGKSDYQTEKGAVNAILSILLREAPDQVFPSLLELSPATIDRRLLDDLIRRTTPSTEWLLKGLEQRSSELRVIAAAELRRRKALPASTAEKLLEDESVRVRYEAMMVLATSGRAMSIELAKAKLARKQENSGRGLGLLMIGDSDTHHETLLDSYILDRKLALSDEELTKEADEAIFDQHAFFALARKSPARYGDALRAAIRDQFRARFNMALTRVGERDKWQSDFLDKIRDLDEFLRKKFTRAGLDQVTTASDPSDLELVRQTIRSGFVDYSPGDLNYLKRFGDWQDIPGIVQSLDRPSARAGGTPLASSSASRFALAAEVIYALSKDRVVDLASLDLPPSILCKVLAVLPAQRVREIPVAQLEAWLQSKDANLRKAVALKAISALPKRTVDKMLVHHLSAEQSYYNVIHWLDFGTSVSRQAMLRGCARAVRDI